MPVQLLLLALTFLLFLGFMLVTGRAFTPSHQILVQRETWPRAYWSQVILATILSVGTLAAAISTTE